MTKENKIKTYEKLVKQFKELIPEAKEKWDMETFEDMREAMLDCPLQTVGDIELEDTDETTQWGGCKVVEEIINKALDAVEIYWED